RIFLLASYRTEEGAASPLLQALLKAAAIAGPVVRVCDVPLEGLTPDESERLAVAVSGGAARMPAAQASAIAHDSGGNPLFIGELVRAPGGTSGASFEQVIQARISRLADPARRLLEVIAVAGQPIEIEIAKQAARHEGADYEVLTALRGGRLARM